MVCSACAHFFEFLPKRGQYAACFDDIESVSTFVRLMRRCVHLREMATSFLIAYFAQLGWPYPDLVTSVPRRHLWSSNISELLAQEFARRVRLPYKRLTRRAFGDLPHEEEPTFFLRRRATAQTILIIDDYMERGKTLAHLAGLLRRELNAKVYGLTVSQKHPP